METTKGDLAQHWGMPLIDGGADESTPEFTAEIKSRYKPTKGGLIVEQRGAKQVNYFVSTSEFELWLGELEGVLGNTFGRKLAHSIAESEELYLSKLIEEMPSPLFSKMKKRLLWINEDLDLRGFGFIEILSESKIEKKVIIHDRPHSAIGAGVIASSIEQIAGQRYRFHWTDDGSSDCLVTLEIDSRHIPPAIKIDKRWKDSDSSVHQADGMHPLELAYKESRGRWSIDGIRMVGLRQDVFLRLEESIIPQLVNFEFQNLDKFSWNSINDKERKKCWSGMASASLNRFLSVDAMVLVAEPDHWVHVGHRFLTRVGLGGVKSAESIDDLGGVRLHLPRLFHPALVCGILTAAWERAEARPGRCTWRCDHNGHFVEISALHDLA
ncbi:MAG: hypothetical protein H8D82_01330 [Euryarchaeota archaeon]|nr:hypothetical protein [Euryarchaeota archaeon]